MNQATKNDTKNATHESAIEALRDAEATAEKTAKALAAERARNAPGTVGEHLRMKAEIAHIEADDAVKVARARARRELDAFEAQAGAVDSPATLLAKMADRLASRAQLADAIARLDDELLSDLHAASERGRKERDARGLPPPEVNQLVGAAQLPKAAPTAAARAYLPSGFAKVVEALEGAIARAAEQEGPSERIKMARGKLRAIEIEMAREKQAAAEAEEEANDRARAAQRSKEAREADERAKAESETLRRAEQRSEEDRLLAEFGPQAAAG